MADFDTLRTAVNALERVEGITPINLLDLPPPLNDALRQLTRQSSMTLEDLANVVGLPVDQMLTLAELLVSKGYLTSESQSSTTGNLVFRLYFARMRRRTINLDL